MFFGVVINFLGFCQLKTLQEQLLHFLLFPVRNILQFLGPILDHNQWSIGCGPISGLRLCFAINRQDYSLCTTKATSFLMQFSILQVLKLYETPAFWLRELLRNQCLDFRIWDSWCYSKRGCSTEIFFLFFILSKKQSLFGWILVGE